MIQTDSALTEQVRETMATVFALDPDELPDDVSEQTCRRWTSLQHMTLMVALEEQFQIRFSMDEMAAMKSLPRIVATLREHGAGAAVV